VKIPQPQPRLDHRRSESYSGRGRGRCSNPPTTTEPSNLLAEPEALGGGIGDVATPSTSSEAPGEGGPDVVAAPPPNTVEIATEEGTTAEVVFPSTIST
jgi:hypothetical protein